MNFSNLGIRHFFFSIKMFTSMFSLLRLGSRQFSIKRLSMLQGLKQPGRLIVDVRTAEEVSQGGTCPGSVHVPLAAVFADISQFGGDKSRPIVFYCKKGIRAADAAEFIRRNGFTNAFSAIDGETVNRLITEINMDQKKAK